jgi:hypothetical protein
MNQGNRRNFIQCVLMASAISVPLSTQAQSGSHVDEAGEQAVALGYKHDTAMVDKTKYPKHAATQHCSNCSFFQGKPDDKWAGCSMFGRKQVAAGGWCLAWNKIPG